MSLYTTISLYTLVVYMYFTNSETPIESPSNVNEQAVRIIWIVVPEDTTLMERVKLAEARNQSQEADMYKRIKKNVT